MNGDRLPWFPCYPQKLLEALSALPLDQKIVYTIVLLRIYDVRGACPDSLEAIATRCGINRRRATEALDKLFRAGKLVRGEGGIHNPLAQEVIARGDALHEERASAGRLGGLRRAKKSKTNQGGVSGKATANPKHRDIDKDSLFPEEGNRAPPEPAADARTNLFRSGLETLARITGKRQDQLRSLLGKWLRSVNDDAVKVQRVIEDAERERVADPVSWIERALPARTGGMPRGAGASRRGFAAALLEEMEKGGNHASDASGQDHFGPVPAGHPR